MAGTARPGIGDIAFGFGRNALGEPDAEERRTLAVAGIHRLHCERRAQRHQPLRFRLNAQAATDKPNLFSHLTPGRLARFAGIGGFIVSAEYVEAVWISLLGMPAIQAAMRPSSLLMSSRTLPCRLPRACTSALAPTPTTMLVNSSRIATGLRGGRWMLKTVIPRTGPAHREVRR